jgi:hypothetical protein
MLALTATTDKVEVAPAEIEAGLAVIVTAAVVGALLPLNNAQPMKRRQKGRKLASRMREVARVVREVCKGLSLFIHPDPYRKAIRMNYLE